MDFLVVERPEISQEIKPEQQCEQQLSTQEKVWEEGMWRCMAKKETEQKQREKGKKVQ